MTSEAEKPAVCFDFDRKSRIGLGEAVLCQGKTPAQIEHILELAEEEQCPLLLTRLEAPALELLSAARRAKINYDPVSKTGIHGAWEAPSGAPEVAIVTAGTSDIAIAREAARGLAFEGEASREIADVGVAGLWRLLQYETELKSYAVVIAVAGMDGALFSVVAGLVPGVVIAVPTSTGYGAARAGETALHAALASCAPGLVVTNIDNGYGAAQAALRVLATVRSRNPA